MANSHKAFTTRHRSQKRNSQGASLALVIAIFGGLTLAIMLFSLKMTGFIGNYHEQKSAIEAATLAVAKDATSIVIDDPNFGLIGLSDFSPIGTDTTAADGYRTSVTGINTLFGTLRLDLIIADYLQDPVMKQLAINDYKNALTAQTNLVAALDNAIVNGGTATDYNGKTINPRQDAINTYNSNKVHNAVGTTSSLATNTLQISLGFLGTQLSTKTPIPQPSSVAVVSASQQSGNCYLPDTDITYGGNDFVFAALGTSAGLVDNRQFIATQSSLPFSTPTVIKIEADEQTISDDGTRTVHAIAAAVPGAVTDQRPYPGFFSVSFPDGPPAEIKAFTDLLNNAQLIADPADTVQTASSGDYPPAPLVSYSLTALPDADPYNPQLEHVLSMAIYDWLKRGGTNVNVQSLVSVLQAPMVMKGQTGGQMTRYHLTSAGTVTNDAVNLGQTNLSVSQKQFRAISGLGLVSTNGSSYDLQITDFVHTSGRTKGGAHAGEPLDYPGQMTTNPLASSYLPNTMYENTTNQYESFTSGSNSIRATYNNEGIAADFTFRTRH